MGYVLMIFSFLEIKLSSFLTEEFFIAALDLKQMDWAQIFLRAICIQFPDNIKSMRMLGMYYEAL